MRSPIDPPERALTMYLNVSQAAKLAGVTRNTIYRALKSGRMSQTAHGIDVAELERVFGTLKVNTQDQGESLHDAQREQLVNVLSEQSAMLREQLEFTRRQLEQAQDRERRLLDIVEQQSRLLTHQPVMSSDTAQEPSQGAQDGGLLRMLFGRRGK
jgi:excisionase family DNA binding protein